MTVGVLAFLIILSPSNHWAVASGVYDLLRLDPTPRGSAMGGFPVANTHGVLGAVLVNPAGLVGLEEKQVIVAYGDHPLDLASGSIIYGQPAFGGVVGITATYFNYGTFDRYETINSTKNGTFGANDLLLAAAYGREVISGLAVGVTGKYIRGAIDTYTSAAVALDAGLYWVTGFKDIEVGGTVANLGVQTDDYAGAREQLPLAFRFGFSKLLEHLPLRLGVTAEKEMDEAVVATAAGEFSVSPLLAVRFGYATSGMDYRLQNASDSIAGFSAGFGLSWRHFRIGYSFYSQGSIGQVHRFGFSSEI